MSQWNVYFLYPFFSSFLSTAEIGSCQPDSNSELKHTVNFRRRDERRPVDLRPPRQERSQRWRARGRHQADGRPRRPASATTASGRRTSAAPASAAKLTTAATTTTSATCQKDGNVCLRKIREFQVHFYVDISELCRAWINRGSLSFFILGIILI